MTDGDGGTTTTELTPGAGVVVPVAAGIVTENEPEGTVTEAAGTDGVLEGTDTPGIVTETSGMETDGH